MNNLSRRELRLWLLAALALALLLYRESYLSIARKWDEDAAFVYGYAVLPIVFWLVWHNRQRWQLAPLRPSWLGALAVLASCLLWIVARGAGVMAVEQAAAVAIVVAMVVAIYGVPAARVQIFPLGFLFFAVPFGRAIVPALMQVTATLSVAALQWSGVPVLRDHMFILIPGGSFEIARACSGFNFAITGLVLGVLYAGLLFTSWRKRLACVIAFVVIPVIANGLRVYLTIWVSYLTDMRFGPGGEHVTYGRIFFLAVLVVMIFWVSRWTDTGAKSLPPRVEPAQLTSASGIELRIPMLFAVLAMLATPAYSTWSMADIAANASRGSQLAALPAAPGWQGSLSNEGAWRPAYQGGNEERLLSYAAPDGTPVSLFVSVYGLGTTGRTEMISYNNMIFPADQRSLDESVDVAVDLTGGEHLTIREVEGLHGDVRILVWSWFVVGGHTVSNEYAVKMLEASAFAFRTAYSERIVTLSTRADEGARSRLRQFVQAHGACVARGLALDACRP